jgi:hypothetical protein
MINCEQARRDMIENNVKICCIKIDCKCFMDVCVVNFV